MAKISLAKISLAEISLDEIFSPRTHGYVLDPHPASEAGLAKKKGAGAIAPAQIAAIRR
jgi:hypothetical protein